MVQIETLIADRVSQYETQLAELLVDAVDSGASVGFLPPLPLDEARKYWRSVRDSLRRGDRRCLIAFGPDGIVGSVQLGLATMPNARHRAEVMKLFVHRKARGQGVGRGLMRAVEVLATDEGRTLLILDTRPGDAAEKLYRSLGYALAGIIPRYARSARGILEDTVYLYKELDRPAGG
jgi:acetyltransferase